MTLTITVVPMHYRNGFVYGHDLQPIGRLLEPLRFEWGRPCRMTIDRGVIVWARKRAK